jgi:hypothetical protein
MFSIAVGCCTTFPPYSYIVWHGLLKTSQAEKSRSDAERAAETEENVDGDAPKWIWHDIIQFYTDTNTRTHISYMYI